MTVALKRVYAAPSPHDGMRVLVDRLWPRGIARDKARIDLWLKDIAPSNALRKRFHAKLWLAHMTLAYMPAESSSVAATYGSATMPSTFVIDPKGIVQYVELGYDKGDEDKLAAKLTELTK